MVIPWLQTATAQHAELHGQHLHLRWRHLQQALAAACRRAPPRLSTREALPHDPRAQPQRQSRGERC